MSLFRIGDDRISTLKHSTNGNAFSCGKSELSSVAGPSRYRDRAIFIAIYSTISPFLVANHISRLNVFASLSVPFIFAPHFVIFIHSYLSSSSNSVSLPTASFYYTLFSRPVLYEIVSYLFEKRETVLG